MLVGRFTLLQKVVKGYLINKGSHYAVRTNDGVGFALHAGHLSHILQLGRIGRPKDWLL
jgi:hypothetical protein